MSDSCRMYKSFPLCCCRVRGSGQATHSHLSASEMTCIVSGGALNSTHSHAPDSATKLYIYWWMGGDAPKLGR